MFAGTDGNGVFLSTDNGTNWAQVNTGLTNLRINSLKVSNTNLFAGTYGGGVFLSTDNGAKWIQVNSGLTNTNILSLAVSANGTGGIDLYAGTEGGAFFSTNDGTNWSSINTGLKVMGVNSLAVSPNETGGSNLLAGTGFGVYISTNNGASWTLVNNYFSFAIIECLVANGKNVFAGIFQVGVSLSTDSGINWSEVNSGLTDLVVYSLALADTNLFAGTYDGVFLSSNNGAKWTQVNSGLTHKKIKSLTISGSNLYAGTFDGGVWYRPLSELVTSVEDKKKNTPTKFSLHQNYPNPFNPSTIIKYDISKEAYVTIKVYDLLGREIQSLVDKEEPAGRYEVRFDASHLASGIYLYQLIAGQFTESKKMVIIK